MRVAHKQAMGDAHHEVTEPAVDDDCPRRCQRCSLVFLQRALLLIFLGSRGSGRVSPRLQLFWTQTVQHLRATHIHMTHARAQCRAQRVESQAKKRRRRCAPAAALHVVARSPASPWPSSELSSPASAPPTALASPVSSGRSWTALPRGRVVQRAVTAPPQRLSWVGVTRGAPLLAAATLSQQLTLQRGATCASQSGDSCEFSLRAPLR